MVFTSSNAKAVFQQSPTNHLTIIIDVPDHAVQLQRGLNQPRQPEDEEDETAQHDNAGEQETLGGEDENENDEEDAEGAGDDHEWEEPFVFGISI
ncbi:unnamed protein product [Aspergillus oryzae]|nr:unnamed protein product [Aspergillus oryzae]